MPGRKEDGVSRADKGGMMTSMTARISGPAALIVAAIFAGCGGVPVDRHDCETLVEPRIGARVEVA